MKVVRLSGNTIGELIQQAAEQFAAMEEADRIQNPKNENKKSVRHDCHCGEVTPDLSKVFYITKKVEDDTVITVFNVIAPFVDKTTIKATLNKVNGDTWLTLRYTNIDNGFKDCFRCNFKIRKEVEYKYNFTDFKVDKKKMKLSYDRGMICLYTESSKSSKTDDFTIGL